MEIGLSPYLLVLEMNGGRLNRFELYVSTGISAGEKLLYKIQPSDDVTFGQLEHLITLGKLVFAKSDGVCQRQIYEGAGHFERLPPGAIVQ